MNNYNNSVKTYYLSFGINELLSSREILKSMPIVYNNIYYTQEYSSALWTGQSDQTYENVIVLCFANMIDKIRQIIRNNFLYVPKWDSLKFTDNDDYGFTFIVGRVRYILGTMEETSFGYHIKLFDANSGICVDTNLEENKANFLDSSINESGEFVRTCLFKQSDMTDENTIKRMAPKKSTLELGSVDTNGYAITNTISIILLVVVSFMLVMLCFYLIR